MLGRRRTLLLTGASRGIGHAAVKKFSAEGWRVLTVSRHPFDERCPWEGGAENHVQLDLQDISSVEDIATILKDKTEGYLDALINNAAVSPKAEDGKRMGSLQTTYNTWLSVFNVNFFSIALLAQALRSELIAARGTVINITSIAGSRVHPFAGSAYAASKAALVALTRELAHDFGNSGVRVNAVAPGVTLTEGNAGAREILDAMVARTPAGRLGTPEDIAAAVVFLASDDAAFVHGATLAVDGGALNTYAG
jgi:NAD(P)-dependent dehydrogenase (short-subunit alcohol dehydrogenase family)